MSPQQKDKQVGFTSIDAYIAREMKRLKIPALTLAVLEDGRVSHTRGFGQAWPGGDPPSKQTLFYIGSLTKAFTALAIMQLVETGQIELEAPIQQYLPWFRVAGVSASAAVASEAGASPPGVSPPGVSPPGASPPGASPPITIRHLLNQTSGLPCSVGEINLANFDSRPDATERQARALSMLVLSRPPGSAFEYCNMNYNLLGLVIETVGGCSYEDYIQRNIFDPLDMKHSTTPKNLPDNSDLAMGYRYWFARPVASPDMPIFHGSLPGGLLISNVEDLSHFLLAIQNSGRYGDVQILSGAGIEQMLTEAAEFYAMGQFLGHYGMGWFISKLGKDKIIWHGGTMPHYYAYMALLPGQNQGLIMLMNACHHWMNPVLTEFCAGATALLAGVEAERVPLVNLFPTLLRSLLLVPVLQFTSLLTTIGQLLEWRRYPGKRPNIKQAWPRQLLLPLVLNLLPGILIQPLLSKRRGYLELFQPDLTLIGKTSGVFGLIWGFIRTLAVIKALERR